VLPDDECAVELTSSPRYTDELRSTAPVLVSSSDVRLVDVSRRKDIDCCDCVRRLRVALSDVLDVEAAPNVARIQCQ